MTQERPPAARLVRQEALDSALGRLAWTMAQLESAVAVFAPDFDLDAFEVAWYSAVPEERNRALVVRSNMDDLYNLCQILIALGVRVAQDRGAIPADRKTDAADQLRAQRLYPESAERVLREVGDLRNASQHEYWSLAPRDVHAAVNRLRQHLPAFIVGVGTWIERLSEG